MCWVSCLCSLAPAETRRSLPRVTLGNTALMKRERIEKKKEWCR